jgi:hypothetical protein
MAKALFITDKELKQMTVLNGNLDPDKTKQFVIIAQDTHIYTYLGSNLFDKINNDIVAGTLSGNYLSLLNNYIKPMVIHWAMVEILPFSAYTIANKGVFKHNSENSVSVEKSEIDYLVEKERQIAQNYTQKFIDYMTVNFTLFPEYYLANTGDTIPFMSANFAGWYLPQNTGLERNDTGDFRYNK